MYNYGRNIALKLRVSLLHLKTGRANDIRMAAEPAVGKSQEEEGHSGLPRSRDSAK